MATAFVCFFRRRNEDNSSELTGASFLQRTSTFVSVFERTLVSETRKLGVKTQYILHTQVLSSTNPRRDYPLWHGHRLSLFPVFSKGLSCPHFVYLGTDVKNMPQNQESPCVESRQEVGKSSNVKSFRKCGPPARQAGAHCSGDALFSWVWEQELFHTSA